MATDICWRNDERQVTVAIKINKNKTELAGKMKLCSNNGRSYFNVYLWNNHEAMIAAQSEEQPPGTEATCALRPYQINIWTGEPEALPLLGELHFVKDAWNLEHVAHEVQHAILHRMRVLRPTAIEVTEQRNFVADNWPEDINCEEIVCYEAGQWVQDVYGFLWEMNPNTNWQRVGNS